jgi:penicillin-binding protein 2
MNMLHALEQSCDIYFYQVARRIGIDRIADMARRFGLGEAHDIGLPGVKSGLIPDEAWKKATFGEAWTGGDSFNAGIGQGYILTSPLQLAVMASRIANGGYAVKPRLVLNDGSGSSGLGTGADLAVPPIKLAQEHLQLIQAGMTAVCNSQRGTGYRSCIRNMPYTMAGKSGSAQVRRISKAERESGVIKNEDLDWVLRDHALFIAFAPVEAPRFAVSVVVEHGGSGSSDAAPIARDMLLETIRRHMPAELASADGKGRP